MAKGKDNASYILITIIVAIILAAMLGCQKEYCYHCSSPIMQDVYYIVDSPEEMQERIDWRIEHLNDTLVCTLNK